MLNQSFSVLVDNGNTSCKVVYVADDNKLIATDFTTLIQHLSLIKKVVYSSVSEHRELNDFLDLCNGKNISCQKIEVQPEQFGIKCGYSNVKNLGVDRWLAVLGAQSLFPDQDLIIVDAGTAMTVDLLDSKNQHLGGWIVPGLSLMQQSIINKAPGVFTADVISDEIIGTDTPSALFHGCISALTGTISQAKRAFSKLMTAELKPKIIVTGGDGKIIWQSLSSEQDNAENVPQLVFYGLLRFIKNM